MHSFYWFFPLLFSIIPTIGLIRENSSIIDIGIITTIFFYFFINRDLSLRVSNTLLILGFLFLLVGIWFFSRYIIILIRIEDSSRKGSQEEDVISFSREARKFTVHGIFTNVLLGAFLAIIASLMGSYSSLGRLTTGRIETVLMIVFTFSLFLVIYKMLNIMASEGE